jgi:hypothetical protein
MDKPSIPEHLQQALDKALHDIAVFLHDNTMMSVAVVDVHHISDAVLGKAQTIVGAIIGGMPVTRGPKHPDYKPLDSEDKTKMVDDIVTRMMDKAKNGGSK